MLTIRWVHSRVQFHGSFGAHALRFRLDMMHVDHQQSRHNLNVKFNIEY